VGEAASSNEVREGRQKKGHAFMQPFKTPRKKLSHDTDDSKDDSFLFQNMMCMMMHQNWIESKQREHQNEQSEHQNKIDAEQREQTLPALP
jgi:hypothetical protein